MVHMGGGGGGLGGQNITQFAGYGWDTAYRFNIHPPDGWFSDGQQWAPQNAYVDGQGLHLRLQVATVDSKYTALSSAEVALVQQHGAPFNPGYGKYLVAAHTAGNFNRLGNNNTVVFGAFTYQKDADGSQINSHRELDMIEASRFGPLPQGWQGDPTNAQFTIQPWDHFVKTTHNNINVNRFTSRDAGDITLTMDWKGAHQPVTFSIYYGIYTDLNQLPAQPAYSWTTSDGTKGIPNQNPLIPNSAAQTVHLNLWRFPQSPTPPTIPEEVIIKAFQYRPY
jgi:hypothetical protein